VKKRGLFQWPVVEQLIQRHNAQQGDYTDHLLGLINLELWFRQFLDTPMSPRAYDVVSNRVVQL